MQAQTVPPILQMVPLLFVFVIMYFIVLRPQQKKEKDRLNMLKKIKKNDEVVTSGGIHAVVLNVKDRTATLRVDDNVKIEVDKDAIVRVEKVA